MQFKDYFKNKFSNELDCVIGCDFKSISQKIPRKINTEVKLVSNAHCAIAKECNQSITTTKIKELRSKSFNPHLKIGDFLKAREIVVRNSEINNLDRKPNPLAISKKRRKIDRMQLADICSQKNYSVGFIVLVAGLSPFVNLDHVAKIDNIKIDNISKLKQ